MIMFQPQYPLFLNDAVRVFVRVLQDTGEVSFIAEDNKQVREHFF